MKNSTPLVLLLSLHLGACNLIASFDPEDQIQGDDGIPDAFIDDLVFEEEVTGTYVAGTSAVLTPVLSWQEGSTPQGDIGLRIRATGGALVSDFDLEGRSPESFFQTGREGNLGRVRVTFPISTTPYEVTLEWAQSRVEMWHPIPGSFQVTETEPVDTSIEGTAEPIRLPRGLKAEVYVNLGPCTDSDFDENGNDVMSLTITRGDIGNLLLVSCRQEVWFVPIPTHDAWLERMVPAEEDTEGPDQLEEVVYMPEIHDTSRDQVFALGGGSDEGSGLFRLSEDLSGFNSVQSNVDCVGMDVVTHHDTFDRGLYWSTAGFIYRHDPESDHSEQFWSIRPYPFDLAIGSYDIYGDHALIVLGCGDDECTYPVFKRYNNLGDEVTLNFHPYHMDIHLEASPTSVFGKYIYAVDNDEISIVVPQDGDEVNFRTVISPQLGGEIVQVTFQSEPSNSEYYHPAGLYILEADGLDPRVLRVFQDLSEPDAQ